MEQNNETEIIEVPTAAAPLEPVGVTQNLDLISDEAILGIFNEVTDNLRNERSEASGLIDNFAELVVNGGDSSTSSKEALVNLVKIRSDMSDKMAKIAEMMVRIKLKQPYGDVVRARDSSKAGNTINIYDQSGFNKRSLIEAIQAKKGKKEDE